MSTTTDKSPAAGGKTNLSPVADKSNPLFNALASVGDIARFSGQVVRGLPEVRKYSKLEDN